MAAQQNHKIVFLRHGESEWNVANIFTGWADVNLSPAGELEAIEAGKCLKENDMKFDVVFTSVLKRSISTAWTALKHSDNYSMPIFNSWRLNERHYGALQGLNKAETAAKHGEAQVKIWRRSYDIPPPPIESSDDRHPANDPLYKAIPQDALPGAESLKLTVERVLPYWFDQIAPCVKSGRRVLVAAHGNSLRAICKYLEGMSEEEVLELNIPTAVPLVYELDRNLKFVKKYYLMDPEVVAAKAAAVANQAKGSSQGAMQGKKVCIVSAGNAAHALAAMWPHMGFETYMWTGFQDEAERMNKGLEAGPITATFGPGNPFEGDIKGRPVKVVKDPAEVIPFVDVIFAPLPSFAYPSVFEGMKPYLRKGQTVIISPGAGGVDWVANEVLGSALFKDINLVTCQPMPFNCRIEEWSRKVGVQVLKRRYDICASPVSALPECVKIINALMPKSEVYPLGPVLAATLIPANAVIHPPRLYTLLTHHHQWAPGKTLPENPFFYEQMAEKDAENQMKVMSELQAIVAGLVAKGINVEIPDLYNAAARIYNGEMGDFPPVDKPTTADYLKLWHGQMYKGFRCPLKQEGDGFVPDFENRYFTEDIPCGLCVYKGVAEIVGVETPFIDELIKWAQGYMNKEYLKDGVLNKELIGEMAVPQRFGIKTFDELKTVTLG